MDLKRIMILVLSIAIVVGTIIGISSCKSCGDKSIDLVETSVVFDEVQSEPQAYVRAWAVADKEIDKITYQIDTSIEFEIETKYCGKADEDWKNYKKDFKNNYYIDTGHKMLDISTLSNGKHILSIYVYQGSEKTCIYEENFKVER